MSREERPKIGVGIDHIERADPVDIAMRRRVRLDPLLELSGEPEEESSERDDGQVGRPHMLLCPIQNRPHTLDDGPILGVAAEDAAETARPLDFAIQPVLIGLVQRRPEGTSSVSGRSG
jgi:hypothetical protein